MKTSLKNLLLLPLLLLTFWTQAQAPYQTDLADALSQLKAVKTTQDLQPIANQLARISEAEPKEWLPAYHTAYAHIQLSFLVQEEPQRDAVLDKAQTYLDRALALQPKESELYALQGYLHQGRLMVSPMARGMKYAGLAHNALQQAQKLNPDNPRVYLLLGQNTFNMPKMFGGGPEAAKPILTTAKEKYAAFQPTTPLHPTWGERNALALLAKCE